MVEVGALKVCETAPGKTRFSAMVGGEDIWLEVPTELAPEPRGELFLAMGLFLAIDRSEDLTFAPDLPLCPDLLARLPYILKILKQWNPEFRLPHVEAVAKPVPARPGMVISSFSGGIDSTFTFSRQKDKITHLFVTNCFDEDGKIEPFQELVDKVNRSAEAWGKRVLPIETNVRQVTYQQNMTWDYLHGPFLCTVASAFGPDHYFIPSSNTTRALKPWGSHPFLDPLWATGTTGITHDGIEESRVEKTCAIAREPDLLGQIQVCWNSKVSNCGKCSKCTRTLLVLHELGVADIPFPPVDPFTNINLLGTTSDAATSHIWDLWQFFKGRGRDDVAVVLRKKIDRYLLKRSREAFVKSLLGQRGQEIFHRLRRTRWRNRRIILRDPDNFE